MSLQKYSGWIGEFDQIVNDIMAEVWRNPSFQLERNWRPMDVKNSDTEYNIEIELPRFKKEEIKVEKKSINTLTVVATNSKASYNRVFTYPDVDLDKTKVRLEDGVLYITIPKLESAKAKSIPIN